MANHQPRAVPAGATLKSFPVSNGATLAAYWTANAKDKSAKHVVIIIHGSLRDADAYFSYMATVRQQQLQAGNGNVDPNMIIVAPVFYSTKWNSGEYKKNQLAWGDSNLWIPGERSNHPAGVRMSSFAVVEELLNHFDNRTQFPNMRNITLVGHSGGGQYVNRLAAVAVDLPKRTHVRFVTADPSTGLYFTKQRATGGGIPATGSCPLYDSWRYGLTNFSISPYAGKKRSEYFLNYINRDVAHVEGLLDTEQNGDQQCMAQMQGGSARINRNLIYWKYLNQLAGTSENVTLFPGNFSGLPNWKHLTGGRIRTNFAVAAEVSHDAQGVLSSAEGVSAVFDDNNLVKGWRPNSSQPIDGGSSGYASTAPPGTPAWPLVVGAVLSAMGSGIFIL
ncbi:hypothetical protein MSPP1_002461 [Malassezia sp. CBS 17886]|nr:hypothetical protein MSPP1_002461 [Malassezia sp. CBS 17886]